jgi:hypothetical protein
MIRRPQFSLRSLFLLTALVAVGCFVASEWGLIAWIDAGIFVPFLFLFWLLACLLAWRSWHITPAEESGTVENTAANQASPPDR